MVSLISKGETVVQIKTMAIVVFAQVWLTFHLNCGTVEVLFCHCVTGVKLRAFS